MKDRVAVFPGSFDPITCGHLDIIERAARLFDRVIVAVGHNPEKKDTFGVEERVEMIQELVGRFGNVTVESYQGLTIDFVRTAGGDAIVRGIRDSVDLRDELQAANTNRMVGDVETVFFMAADEYGLTSSTYIKQIVAMGGQQAGRLSALVPESVLKRLQQKFAR
jgi:pantetheine-phosphate adenylyltransferase